ELVGDTQPRTQVRQPALDVQVEPDSLGSRDQHLAGPEVYVTTLAGSVDGLGTIQLPSQSVINRQLLRDAKCILPVEEPAILLFAGVVDGAYIALEDLDVAEQECGQAGASASRTL